METRDSSSSMSPECCKEVDIIRSDLKCSMDLPKQSHNCQTSISQASKTHSGEKKSKDQIHKRICCSEYGETVDALNSNVSQNHTIKAINTFLDKSSDSDLEANNVFEDTRFPLEDEIQTVFLNNIFSELDSNLKAHKGFISGTSSNNMYCNVCEVKLDTVYSILEHLVTRFHEDKTILFLKSQIPDELHDIFEFVSFSRSSLYCNLCRSDIELCSNNPYKTILNISAHNASKTHLVEKGSKETNKSDEANIILKSFAVVNPLIDSNKHFIKIKSLPQFKCKLCNDSIAYREDENELFDCFNSHFTSLAHAQYMNATTLLKMLDESNIIGKEYHNFMITDRDQSIYCSICDCYLESNYDKLVDHVEQFCSISHKNTFSDISRSFSDVTLSSSCPERSSTPLPSNSEYNTGIESYSIKFSRPSIIPKTSLGKLDKLFAYFPDSVQHKQFFIEYGEKQLYCRICERVFPAAGLRGHLYNKTHPQKAREILSPSKLKDDLKGASSIKKPEINSSSVKRSITYHSNLKVPTCYVSCFLCNKQFTNHREKMMKHFKTPQHTSSIKKINYILQSNDYKDSESINFVKEQMKKTDDLRNCAKYLAKVKGCLYCMVCKTILTNVTETQSLSDVLLNHFMGVDHKKKCFNYFTKKCPPYNEETNKLLMADSEYINCKLCSWKMDLLSEESEIIRKPLSHLTSEHSRMMYIPKIF